MNPLSDEFLQASERSQRRTRVALACSRCKARKSKCDGAHPSCQGCLAANVTCQYPPSTRLPGKTQYIRALEHHIVELEKRLENFQARSAASASVAGASSQNANSPAMDGSSPALSLPAGVDIDDDNALVALIRDLSCDSGGVYVGASSNISMGRMMSSLLRRDRKMDTPISGKDADLEVSRDLLAGSVIGLDIPAAPTIGVGDISQDIADRLYNGYLQHISTRWPILHTPFIADLHRRREGLVQIEEHVLLHLIYANGGRYLETTGETGIYFPERHYDAALAFLEDIVGYRDIRAVQVLLLLGIYSLRAPNSTGAWNYVGLAMRTCVELGLHRRRSKNEPPSFEFQLQSRVFWSGYILDRQISIALGRPFALPDYEIDSDLPLDISEELGEEEFLSLSLGNPLRQPTPTSLACFRHTIRIRQIESRLKEAIYRLDCDAGRISEATVERFRAMLDEWRDDIPAPFATAEMAHLGPRPYDGHDYYLHFYFNCLRQLYFPIVLSQRSRYVKECAEACVGVCETFKKMHRVSVVGYSLWALQTVFLAGLTLVFTIWIDPDSLYSQRASNALNDCNLILYIIVERWPKASKYRDAFEEIKDSLPVLLSERGTNPGQRPMLAPNSGSSTRELLCEQPGLGRYEIMVTEMMRPESSHTNTTANEILALPPSGLTPGSDAMAFATVDPELFQFSEETFPDLGYSQAFS